MLTKTIPFLAMASPSYMGTALPPLRKPPPYIHTMTGRFSPADFAAVHTLRYRQSSLMGSLGIRNSSDHMLIGTGFSCMGLGPKLSHLRTPPQGFTGCGSFHLRSPTGGAAKGIPLN